MPISAYKENEEVNIDESGNNTHININLRNFNRFRNNVLFY